jgi:hypothetical protein
MSFQALSWSLRVLRALRLPWAFGLLSVRFVLFALLVPLLETAWAPEAQPREPRITCVLRAR